MTSLTVHHDATGEATVSIESVVFLLLKDSWQSDGGNGKVIEVLETLHLYDKTVLRRLMNHLTESFSVRQYAAWEIMWLAQKAVQICRDKKRQRHN